MYNLLLRSLQGYGGTQLGATAILKYERDSETQTTFRNEYLTSRARVSVSKSGVRTSGVLSFDVRYARAFNLDVVCTPDKLFWTYAGRARMTNCMK